MFRISQFMQEIAAPTSPGPVRKPSGPVVIWNLVRRCNLTCKHCYSISADKDFAGELSTAEVFDVMDDLKGFGVPALILSGGEPLLRPDIFDIAARSKALGFYTALSSNGTLIDAAMCRRIARQPLAAEGAPRSGGVATASGMRDAGFEAAAAASASTVASPQAGPLLRVPASPDFDYVGVSLDGMGATHDRFRRMAGAFDKSLAGIRLCRDAGLKVGVRFTLTLDNFHDLPALLQLVEDEGIDRYYLSHLNYAGRGNKNRRDDVHHQMTRQAMDLLFETCWKHQQQGLKKEFTTGNNDADGVYLLHWVERRFPDRAGHIRARLEQWGGNSSGVNVANIDNLGNVHPDTMWWHHPLGNVRERPFSQIWPDISDPLMAGLKAHPRHVGGRCGQCAHFGICGGNTRVRAQQTTGDPWAEDPGCYLTDEEIR